MRATLVIALVAIIWSTPAAGSPAVPQMANAAAAASPLTFKTANDSVLLRFGDFQQWVVVTGLTSPDTSYLGPGHDLMILSRLDSIYVREQPAPVTIHFVRKADTLSAVFYFASQTEHFFAKYRALLARYSRYSETPLDPPAAFDDSPLENVTRIRQRLRLDEVAGPGSDLSRMRNLLHWVHTSIKWDGSKENPNIAGTAERVEACMTNGLTMNCGGLASTYVSLCQAAGLHARQIVGMPCDRNDTECHSVAIVYCDSLGGWVYMDPTFEAWWTDSKGRLLDLEQARATLARGDSLIVNPGANVNGIHRDAREHLAYMSKNLFRFKTWLDPKTEIFLNPAGYDSSSTGTVKRSATGLPRTYATDNARVFWALPKAVAAGGR